MRAVWRGTTLAESDEPIVVEGNCYFPPESVRWERYFTVVAEGERNRNAAWTYPTPWPWIGKIRSHVAFWGGVEIRP